MLSLSLSTAAPPSALRCVPHRLFSWHVGVASPSRQGVPEILVELVKALEDRGLETEGIYRVPGRASRLQNFIDYVNANPSIVSGRLETAAEPEILDSRTISSAIKRFFALLPESVLKAEDFSSVLTEGLDDKEATALTPVKLARLLVTIRTSLERKFEATSSGDADAAATAEEMERKWRMATLNFILRHLREVAALQTHNHMSPRALSLCFAPSLFGCPKRCRTKSLVQFAGFSSRILHLKRHP
ncbi:Rho GTPase-activating protein 45 [Cleaved into: Minor histocompatibility antigen HA-1 [Sparganum proliferum]